MERDTKKVTVSVLTATPSRVKVSVLIKRIVLLAIIFAMGLPGPVLAAEDGAGMIESQVINGTNDGISVFGQEVTLKIDLSSAEVGSMIVLIFSFTYLQRKRKLQPVRAKVSADKSRFLAELAQLDDDFEDGKIKEDVYHRLRDKKKSQLVALIQRSEVRSGKR